MMQADQAPPEKKHRLRENKTIMLPRKREAAAEAVKRRPGIFARLFGSGKEEKARSESAPSTTPPPYVGGSERQEIPEEPEILREIDKGRHSRKVEHELELWLVDGRRVKSLDDLREALKTISTRAFNQHRKKQDISDWVREVAASPELALRLERAGTKDAAIKILQAHREEPEEKAAGKSEPRHEKEINSAISSMKKKPSKKGEMSLAMREKKLEEEKFLISAEEEHLSKKRTELARRARELVRKQADIEEEKAVGLSEKKEHYVMPGDDALLPKLRSQSEDSKEKMKSLILKARSLLRAGNDQAAEKIRRELAESFQFSVLEPREAKEIEYEILELETDIKLAEIA